jgi:hypothetical protein
MQLTDVLQWGETLSGIQVILDFQPGGRFSGPRSLGAPSESFSSDFGDSEDAPHRACHHEFLVSANDTHGNSTFCC